MRRGNGFTLSELLTLMAVLTLAGFVLFLSVEMGRPEATAPPGFIGCMKNLMTIGKAFALYRADHDDKYPLLTDRGDATAAVGKHTVSDKLNDGKLGTNAMQNVWVLMEEGKVYVSQAAFHCPSDRTWTERTATARYGWTSDTEFSYGLHWPYARDAGGNENPAALSIALDEGFTIMADQCPAGGTVGEKVPPSNHPKEGTIYLTARGGVACPKSPNNAVINGDDVYLNVRGVRGGLPASHADQVLVP